jgi:hypothetical protein
MKNWFISLRGASTLAVTSLLVFLGRTFIDFYYVYDEFSLSVGLVGGTILIHMALFGGWIWSLLSAVQGNRRGLIAVFGFNLFFFLFIAVGTLVSYCPSPCRTGWPLGEIAIWASLVAGLLAAISLGIQIRRDSSEKSADSLQTEVA